MREAEAHALSYRGPAHYATVTISTATTAAHLRYTLDDSQPSPHNGTEIRPTQGYVTITPLPNAPKRKQLQAIAYKKVWDGSLSGSQSELTAVYPE
jgi:hypothetical protein